MATTDTYTWTNWSNSTTASTSSSVWSNWCSNSGNYSTSTATSSTADIVWRSWTGTSTATTVSSDYVWSSWCSDTNDITVAEYVPPTQEQQEQWRAEAEARRIELQAAQEEKEKLRLIAEQKAFALLKSGLSEEQVKELEEFEHFFVKGEKTGRRYRVRKGRSGNVDVFDGEKISHRLCFHPRELCPDPDTMLAQKLLLETNEEAALRMANRHPAH